MKRHVWSAFLSGALLLLAYSGSSDGAPSYLMGVGWTGEIYRVDKTSGLPTLIRSTGLGGAFGIEYVDGVLYVATVGATPWDHSLYSVSLLSGEPTLIGDLHLLPAEGDLAYDPTTDTLWGGTNGFNTTNFGFFTINRVTGQATVTAPIPPNFADYSGMTFDQSGTFYAVNTGVSTLDVSELMIIDKATGAVLSTKPLNVELGAVAGMDYDPTDGTFYVADSGSGGTNKLYTLDVLRGNLSQIGATAGLTGLTVVHDTIVVPVPSAFLLVASGLLSMGLRRRTLSDSGSRPKA